MRSIQGCTAYLAVEDFVEQLSAELTGIKEEWGHLILADGPPQQVYWKQNVWYDPQLIEIDSISDGVRKLKALQRNWKLYSWDNHRRAGLIQEQLPYWSDKPLVFPCALPKAPLGSWMLLEPNLILAAPRCESPFAHGVPIFAEDREGAPSRAYLKLWEALTLLQQIPKPGENCLEVGASPGGWTWVLANLGATVTAVDRSELAPEVARMRGVTFKKGNAFSIMPEDVDHIDWLFSDVICYPEKLYEWVMRWIESGKCGKFVCTLKFQGDEHYGVIKDFAAIPGSRVVHLSQNKHELTWMLAPGSAIS